VIELGAGVELVDEVVAELAELRIDLFLAGHEVDRLNDEAFSVEPELNRIAETGCLESSHYWSAAFELTDLVEKLVARRFRECDRSPDGLDEWQRRETIA
jgi:hypothetical protein